MTRLVLYGTVCGEPVVFGEDELAVEETFRSMIRVGWAREDPTFRRVFTTRFIPDATEEQLAWFDDLQRMSTSPKNAVGEPDRPPGSGPPGRDADDLGPDLALQAVGDRSTTFDNAVSVCASIPGSRLVPLQSRNHILLADEPAWQVFGPR